MHSVVVKSVNPELIDQAVRALVQRWAATFPGVEEVIWFGSWVRGNWGPASDVDLCIILGSDSRRIHDRIPGFLPTQFPVGLEIFPYTREEFESLARTQPGWHREIIAHGRVVFSRATPP